MNRPLNQRSLYQENLAFAGTKGVSRNNRCERFVPAFRDEATGRVEIARFEDGSPAPMHLIAGLPEEWAVARAPDGAIIAVKASVVAGFVRGDVFYTREAAAALN